MSVYLFIGIISAAITLIIFVMVLLSKIRVGHSDSQEPKPEVDDTINQNIPSFYSRQRILDEYKRYRKELNVTDSDIEKAKDYATSAELNNTQKHIVSCAIDFLTSCKFDYAYRYPHERWSMNHLLEGCEAIALYQEGFSVEKPIQALDRPLVKSDGFYTETERFTTLSMLELMELFHYGKVRVDKTNVSNVIKWTFHRYGENVRRGVTVEMFQKVGRSAYNFGPDKDWKRFSFFSRETALMGRFRDEPRLLDLSSKDNCFEIIKDSRDWLYIEDFEKKIIWKSHGTYSVVKKGGYVNNIRTNNETAVDSYTISTPDGSEYTYSFTYPCVVML